MVQAFHLPVLATAPSHELAVMDNWTGFSALSIIRENVCRSCSALTSSITNLCFIYHAKLLYLNNMNLNFQCCLNNSSYSSFNIFFSYLWFIHKHEVCNGLYILSKPATLYMYFWQLNVSRKMIKNDI